MPTQIFEPALTRKIIQVRFRPTLVWFNTRSAVASPLEDKYHEWRSDNYGNVALYSPDDKKALEVFTNQITYITESETNSNEGIEHVTQIVEKSISDSKVSQIRRNGFRQTIIYKSDIKFDEIVDLLDKKLFNQSADIKKLKGNVRDSTFVIDSESDGVSSHVQIGAINKDQGKTYFASNFDLDAKPENDNNLFVDIDTFTTNGLTGSNFQDSLKNLSVVSQGILDGYLNYISKG